MLPIAVVQDGLQKNNEISKDVTKTSKGGTWNLMLVNKENPIPENYDVNLVEVEGGVWHYRYVGQEAAKEIYERGICLEEYLEDL